MDKKSIDIQEIKEINEVNKINDRISNAVQGIMAIFVFSSFLISGDKDIMYYTGIALCILTIFEFLLDIIFMIKDKIKKNI